jgi:hypothetical protein
MDDKDLEQFISNLENVKNWLDNDPEFSVWLDKVNNINVDDLYEDYRGTNAS